ncbi:MAG TPA: diguanylate cyclase, partial [Burkholderiales bacterium]|nr:diguanylate cyclase [Burkholderiales bacterium]
LQSDFVLRYEWVSSMAGFSHAAARPEWDIIVCDASFFDIRKSLGLARQSGAHIFFVAEDDDAETALSVLKTGSTNILLKSRLGDLARKVKRLPEKRPSECAFFDKLHSAFAKSDTALVADEDGYVEYAACESHSVSEEKPPVLSNRLEDSLNMLDMMCFDSLIQDISDKTSGLSGSEFLQSVVESLARVLGAERVFIGVPAETNRVRIISRSNPEDFECIGSPCIDVLSGVECHQPGDAGSIYPECEWLRESGSFYGFPLFNSGKKPIGLLGIADDLPIGPLDRLAPILRIIASRAASELEFQHALSLLRESEEDFRLNFELVSIGMAHVSLDGKWLKANPALCRTLEYEESELCSTRFHAVFHPEDLAKALELQANLLVGSIPSFSIELRFRKSNGQAIWVNLTLSLLRDERNCPRHLVAVIADISGRKRAEEQIHFLANHDTLTKLPNRNFLLEKLGNTLAHAESANRKLAILLLDLDRFKLVNDSLGHAAGDRLMSFCGQYIAGCLETDDLSARLGSDEFAIVCSRAETAEGISAFSEKLLSEVSTPTRMEDMDIAVTGCIGIAVYPDDGEDISTLLRKADAAMYCAKDAGGNHYRFYHEGMDVRTMDHLVLVNDLRHAIDRDEFVIHYQP